MDKHKPRLGDDDFLFYFHVGLQARLRVLRRFKKPPECTAHILLAAADMMGFCLYPNQKGRIPNATGFFGEMICIAARFKSLQWNWMSGVALASVLGSESASISDNLIYQSDHELEKRIPRSYLIARALMGPPTAHRWAVEESLPSSQIQRRKADHKRVRRLLKQRQLNGIFKEPSAQDSIQGISIPRP